MYILSSIFSITKGYNNFQIFSPIHLIIIIFVVLLSLLILKINHNNKYFIKILTILAIIESIFASPPIKISLIRVVNKFFLIIFHLSYCLFYEKMVKYMSKYFFNIYIYILLRIQICKNK